QNASGSKHSSGHALCRPWGWCINRYL
ncbi:hypothetical protein THAOC_31518, partial [Thalassiosira oceanica]